MEPGSNQYMILPVAVVRAAAALPAAPTWDTDPLVEVMVMGYGTGTFYVTYTRAAVGGAVDLQLQFALYLEDQAGVEDWFTQSLYAPGAVVGGIETASAIQTEYITYTSTAAGAENFVLDPIVLGGTVSRVRLRCRESGVPGTPGACHIFAQFGGL